MVSFAAALPWTLPHTATAPTAVAVVAADSGGRPAMSQSHSVASYSLINIFTILKYLNLFDRDCN